VIATRVSQAFHRTHKTSRIYLRKRCASALGLRPNGANDPYGRFNRHALTLCSAFLVGLMEIGFLLSPSSAIAQLSSAAINGTVQDATGAAVVGAQISLRGVTTGTVRTTKSNSVGNYAFIDVAPGSYAMKVVAQGFATAQQSAFVLQVNQTATFNFSLNVGSETQQVTVAANSAELQTSTANLGTVINGTAVDTLPLNGRNFTQLLTLTPGASRANTSQNSGGQRQIAIGSFSFPSVNGQMNRSNLYMLDGIIDQQLRNSEYAVPPIVDGIAEFKVQSHDDQSQFGGVMGGIVNVVTKSGTNQFHGDAWEFLRNDAFDAKDPLLPKVTPLKQNVFGATIGGPVLAPHYNGRDHTFFFGSYEGVHINSANESLYNVPTAAEEAGDFSGISQQLYNPYTTTPSGTRTPFTNNDISSAIDPAMQTLVKQMYPAPVPSINGFNGVDTTPAQTRQNNYSLRVDEQINGSNSLWARLSQDHTTKTASGGFVGLLGSVVSDSQNWGVGYLHTFGASATLQLSAGHVWQLYNDVVNYTHTVSVSGFNPLFGCSYISPLPCGAPNISVTGYAGGGVSYTSNNDGDVYQWSGDFTKLAGHHTWQIGAMMSNDSGNSLITGGNLSFSAFQTSNLASQKNTGNAMASFLIGAPTSAKRENSLRLYKDGWVNAVYGGDQWKISSKLTMNIGLRYDWVLMPVQWPTASKSNMTGDLDLRNGTYILSSATASLGSCATLKAAPCIPGGALPAHVVQGTGTRMIQNQLDNFQPRLGLAYQLDQQRVIHISYDRVFDTWSGSIQTSENLGDLWPSVATGTANNLNTTTVTATAENPLNFASGITNVVTPATPFTLSNTYIAPYSRNPYSDQWLVGIQQQLGAATMFTLNYVGSRTSRLPCCYYMNVAVSPGPGSPQSRAPYTYIKPTKYIQSNGSASYNAMQVQLARKSSSGLAYTINYTWSKNLDVACDGYFGAEGCFVRNPYNPAADRSVAGMDLPQMVTADVLYPLPFGAGQRFRTGSRIADLAIGGWQLNGIATLTSGNPFTVSYSGDVANTGNVNQGVDQIASPRLDHPTIGQWFNTAAFQAPAQYTYGNVGRNTLRSDWYKDVDLSVFRNFTMERARMEFRAEAFNLTNTAVWAAPNATLNSTTFGKVSNTASTQRELQMALKIYF
jgi:Carboxypeptidase regulatory-like domain